MNFEFDLKVTISVIMGLITMVYAWFRTRRQDVDERFNVGSKKMAELEKRTALLEQQVAAMPEKDDLHRMEIALERITGKMDVVATHMAGQKDVMKRLDAVVTRHEDHLLSGANTK